MDGAAGTMRVDVFGLGFVGNGGATGFAGAAGTMFVGVIGAEFVGCCGLAGWTARRIACW